MGLAVAVEGDMTTPPVGKGDLFLVTPGEISTALALNPSPAAVISATMAGREPIFRLRHVRPAATDLRRPLRSIA